MTHTAKNFLPTSRLGGEHEIDRVARRIHGSVEVGPGAGDSDVGLIDTPGTIRMSEFSAKALIQKGRIALDPAPDGDVVNGDVPLGHDLLQIAVREGIS